MCAMSIAIALSNSTSEGWHESDPDGASSTRAARSSAPTIRSSTAPHPRVSGLENITEARATLARMLGGFELALLNGRGEDCLDELRKDAASLATHLSGVEEAFVAVEGEVDDDVTQASESPASFVRRSIERGPSREAEDAKYRLDDLCSRPARNVEGFLSEVSLALNKMAAAFMRVSGSIELEQVPSDRGYDPSDEIRNFPRILTDAASALQASDYELASIRRHQRLLATVLLRLGRDREVARALEEAGELGPLGTFLKDMLTETRTPSEDTLLEAR